MNKMQMAHEWFITSINNGKHVTIEQAWCYADAMQAEADERNKAEAEQKRKEVREILSDANTFIEREGQHFDDVNECEVDWSQAPTNESEELNYWCMDENGDPWWFSVKPRAKYGQWNSKNETGLAIKAPSFNYQGNWQDSLRKRPQ